MRRYRPVLHIAVVSACASTASELAERINERGQFAHVFTDAKSLCEFTQLQSLDIILVDRRGAGFAMTLHALRAFVRSIPSYAMFCAFGAGSSLVPAGLDYSYCQPLTGDELASLFDEVLCAMDVEEVAQLVC